MNFLGVDIGGTKIATGVVDSNGKVLAALTIPTPSREGGAAVLQAAVDISRQLLESVSVSVNSIGVGTGGQVNSSTGVVLTATDLLPGWAGQRISDRFTNEFGLPAFVENDVNALAVGELRCAGAPAEGTVVFLAIGTGLGGALLVDGKIYHGTHWSGGEIGQMIIDIREDARTDGAGNRGTFEAFVSGHGLVTTWGEITGDNSTIDGYEIARDAQVDSGGPGALAISKTGHYLGLGLVSVVSLIDPQLIVIGGGMAALGEMLLDPARKTLAERAHGNAKSCPIVSSSLGSQSSIIGAAAVAMVKAHE